MAYKCYSLAVVYFACYPSKCFYLCARVCFPNCATGQGPDQCFFEGPGFSCINGNF